ncbi:relaxase/mobilization nuclease domain-containing protein [Algoriphagus confluentis]|uniref:Conjugal transfer protein MobB n=1 Tax=Algoriphagus confluentis TaxID=1697556 RepID=A0ABQ6PRW1_9BACT|nr:conjugal transfer protein MobB [Algoriphagus confluentis]
MVVRISTGKSIQGVVRYNDTKRKQSVAQLIGSRGFAKGVENLTANQLVRRFELLTSLNRRTHTNAIHVSLNFAPGERLSDEKLNAISHSYLDKIGFGNQPCLIYQHQDAGHPHVHLVTVNIDREGKRIETHNLGKNQSEQARKEIEREYGLVPAEKQQRIGPGLQELGKLIYGKETSKSSINTVLNQVWANYVFTSLGEYNAILSGFGVAAYRGEKDSQRYKRRGLVYHVLDEKGSRKGVPVKASCFYLQPTLKKLEGRFLRDQVKKKEVLGAVKSKVLEILQKSKSMDQFLADLKKNGVQLVLNHTQEGKIFGTTYVDHFNRIGIKGSDLGKEFGAHGLSERFGLMAASARAPRTLLPSNEGEKGRLVLFENPVSVETGGTDLSLRFSDSPYQGPSPGKRKKKRKKKDNPSE